ncbi:MAG: glucosamine-6-phosphate deaminase [Clostridiales bacterium]|nr:glucosamine-6-phosphate deaminase [Clostridiales bacterium]
MKIIIVKNYIELSALAADFICDTLIRNSSATLGLATGSTPLGAYSHLRDRCSSGQISFKNVKVFNLDEYVELHPNSVHSYAHFMKVNLFDGTDMDLRDFHIPCGNADDLDAECKRYDRLLSANPRNLQLLGLGSNGHIAFNEPLTPFERRTHVVELAASTVADNSRLFENDSQVPRRAITMGIRDIVAAERILLLASGINKAQAVLNMIKGEVSVDCPASVLQRHPDATVIIDGDAASLL